MRRRDLLKLAGITFPVVGLSLVGNSTTPRANGHEELLLPNAIEEVILNPRWHESQDVYYRLQWGALTYETLVSHYGAPDGRVPERDGPSYDRVLQLMPWEFEEWHASRALHSLNYSSLNAKQLVSVLLKLQEHNADVYTAWLQHVGIVPSGHVSAAILSGQVLATVVSLGSDVDEDGIEMTEEEIESEIADWEWWFYPLCLWFG